MNPEHDMTYWADHHAATEYIAEIHRMCGLNRKDKHNLPPYLQQALDDVEGALCRCPSRLARILDQRLWDHGRLARRGEQAKPRVDIYVTITSKGNLSVLWWPRADDDGGRAGDFSGWGRDYYLNDETDVPYRPNNELLFIREIRDMAINEDRGQPAILRLERRALYAARAVSRQMADFLDKFCEVRVIKDFEFTLDKNHEVMAWDIVDVADRWVETFKGEHGITLAEFLAAIAEYRADNGAVKADKASRKLRDGGLAAMMPKKVETLARDFERFRQWPDFQHRHRELFRAKAPVIPIR